MYSTRRPARMAHRSPRMNTWQTKHRFPIRFCHRCSRPRPTFILNWLSSVPFSLRHYLSVLLSHRRPTGIRFHFFIPTCPVSGLLAFSLPHSLCPPCPRHPLSRKRQRRPTATRRSPHRPHTTINTRSPTITCWFPRQPA